jgi:hypothetical protein
MVFPGQFKQFKRSKKVLKKVSKIGHFFQFFHFGPFFGPLKVGIMAISLHQIIPQSLRIPEHVLAFF